MNKKVQKKRSPALWIILVAVYILGTILESAPAQARLALLIVFAAVAIIVVAFVIVIKSAKKNGTYSGMSGTPVKRTQEELFEHSHDRVPAQGKAVHHTPQEEWKIQLDGFLQAGLIDRAEYKVLWEKHQNDKPIYYYDEKE